MKIKFKLSFITALGLIILFSCKKTETPSPAPQPTPILSDDKQITTYGFNKVDNSSLTADVITTVDETNKTIKATLPYGTNLTSLKANFTISSKATLKIGNMVQLSSSTINDFSQSVTLTVTAENGTSQNYTASISIAQPPTGSSNIVVKREEFAAGPPVQTVPILTAEYAYNNSDLLTRYHDNYGTYLFEYDANGLLKTQIVKDNSGNVSNTFTYTLNAAKQVSIIVGTYGQTLENFSYDAAGQLTKYTKSYYGAIKDTYEYTNDSKGRVKTAKYISSSDPIGTYTLYNYQYYDNILDPDPMIKVFIRPNIGYGIEPSTQKAYALKSYNYQKYDINGAIGSNPSYEYTYTTNANGYLVNTLSGTDVRVKYTFK